MAKEYSEEYRKGWIAGANHFEARIRREEVEPLREALRRLIEAANDLREASEEAYRIARIPAIPFVKAGNVISEARAALRAADERGK